MEAERSRVAHKALQTQLTTLSELSALGSVIEHVSVFLLSSNEAIREICSLDELLEMIEVRKGNFWGKLFKGNNEKSKIKKKAGRDPPGISSPTILLTNLDGCQVDAGRSSSIRPMGSVWTSPLGRPRTHIPETVTASARCWADITALGRGDHIQIWGLRPITSSRTI
ncbi:hypothetical protein DFH28DRAFT_933130 [Melampsora americana]|nr:hypothetical protein DFH28DRAFT_933130 [Melampsora americana]